MSVLGDLFRDRAERAPDRPAFRSGGRTLSYGEVWQQAQSVAVALADHGVTRGDRVGILMTKGLEMPVAIHGIWMVGAAYVPLDPSAPVERLAGTARDCGMGVILTAARNAPLAQELADLAEGVAIRVDALEPSSFDPVPGDADDLAYIIFTSGSTGRPKGIVHTHASGLAFAKMWTETYGVQEDDVCFCTVPLHFDFSLADFIAIPLSGASTELVPEVALKFPASLAKQMETSGATIWSTVPHALIQLCERGATADRDLSRLRTVIFGGEPLAAGKLPLIFDTLPNIRLSNSYGPAEVNQVTEFTVPRDHSPGVPIPIGGPTSHVSLALSDESELLVSTAAMMQGYWNRPDLNDTAFEEREGRVYYPTGDLAERGPDGLWRLIGRADRQVKLRGYRIELDEIERVLASHPAVSEAAAILSSDKETLVAFITPGPGQTADPDALRSHAAAHLPPYAVPSRIECRESFARTTTGKIDRRSLAEEMR